MTHFAEARENASNFFCQDQALRQQLVRACLIWDLEGRLRVLIEPAAGVNVTSASTHVDGVLKTIAAPFWSGDIWMWTKASSKSERGLYEKAWAEAQRAIIDPGPPEIRGLERHVSKDAWFASQINPPWPWREETEPIIAFYSFKGGVGRTTALLSLAMQLSRSGLRVAVVDLDLEAPGVLAALPPSPGAEPACGVIDYLLERPLVAHPNDLDLADFYYTVDDPLVIKGGAPLVIVPAGRVDGAYLEKLARLDYERLHALMEAGADQSPLVDLLKQLRRELKAQYVLLDSRAGFHDLGGLALSGTAHLDVLFGLDSEQSWAGMRQVVRFLGRDRLDRGKEQLACALVYAMAPDPGKRDDAVDQFKERAYLVFSEEYYAEEGADNDDLWTLPDQDAQEQPHFPLVVGFNPLVQRYQSAASIADQLAEGDFRLFAERVLERVGRKLP